jgi:hypothetical protein
VAKTRPISWNHQRQGHARKFHSYFWVFSKSKRYVGYSTEMRQPQCSRT